MPSSVGEVEDRPEQGGRRCPWPCRSGIGAQRGQVPVGLPGMETVHLEQQTQGPHRCGRCSRNGAVGSSWRSSLRPLRLRSGLPHTAVPARSSVV